MSFWYDTPDFFYVFSTAYNFLINKNAYIFLALCSPLSDVSYEKIKFWSNL